jgi:choline dehydrogenase
MMGKTYDYVIVGAGSAGCVLAGRLSEDSSLRVCLLEAGPPDRSIFIHMPAGYDYLMQNPRYNWRYRSEPAPGLDGRRIYCPRGRGLGGSSSINGQVFLRGHPLDYEAWADSPSLRSWSYAHVLPYFKRLERWSGESSAYRGTDGPVGVTRPERFSNPLSQVFIEAGQEAGHPLTADVNGYQQEGVFHIDQSIHGGRRSSAAVSYLRKRSNLTILTEAFAHNILFEGQRAVGVRYSRKGARHEVRCEREVLLCAGAVNSPQMLMTSGVGRADDLARIGVPVVHDLPGVGENLQDHVEVYILTECTKPITLYGVMTPMGKARIGLEWLLTRRGLGATNHFEAGAYYTTDSSMVMPNIQNALLPLAITYEGGTRFKGHGYAVSVGIMRPSSRGHIKARSPDPTALPEIQVNYFQSDSDVEELYQGLTLTREILSQRVFDPYRGHEISPGPEVQNKAAVHSFLKENISSVYHLCGTCRMGGDDLAVVDEELRVRGLEGLRVVDASIMPSVPSANTNASVLMIGEKAADMILEKTPLPPQNLPFYAADVLATRST